MQDKKFWSVTAGIVVVLFVSWSFVISPTQQQISQYKRKCKNLHGLTNQIHSQDYPPYDHVVAYVSSRQTTLKKNIERLSSKIMLKPQVSPSPSPADFRRELEKKSTSIENKTNRLAIKFDKKLGFAKQILKVSPRHYIHLHIIHHALWQLTEIVEKQNKNLDVSHIEHLTLAPKTKQLINKYSIRIKVSAQLHTVMQWLHTLSQPVTGQEIFFHIDKVVFQNQKQSSVEANITISAANIDLEKKNTTVPKEQQQEKDTSDPLWERY
ncbi:hypothetical protein [Candidatus Uabimicrobium amorphum]|uniref:Uncharacterized protein n=1 Tax=Uabimicrobium amorphum TaxID=2596890 RepID=A0A5S9F1S5_UABAM|nr:hypothetical protein [Candidatus Uabimicrobium amorphum]BBM82925.1 hypothetical protein UABAM_01268 [Candidatus Uabimicrobium amorphum]